MPWGPVRYREQGWWTGEKLADRFDSLVHAAPHRRAIVDERGNALTRQELSRLTAASADAFLPSTGSNETNGMPRLIYSNTLFIEILSL